ncbi:hypothetical protein PanWU01x14_272160, partial [Parasponia andersonii]
MDNKATRRKLAPTANENLHCLKEDYKEVKPYGSQYQHQYRPQCWATTRVILRISILHKVLETKKDVDMLVSAQELVAVVLAIKRNKRKGKASGQAYVVAEVDEAHDHIGIGVVN